MKVGEGEPCIAPQAEMIFFALLLFLLFLSLPPPSASAPLYKITRLVGLVTLKG